MGKPQVHMARAGDVAGKPFVLDLHCKVCGHDYQVRVPELDNPPPTGTTAPKVTVTPTCPNCGELTEVTLQLSNIGQPGEG